MTEAASSTLDPLKTSVRAMRKFALKRNGQRINVGRIIAPERKEL